MTQPTQPTGDDVNPHAGDDRARVAAQLASRLRDREIPVSDADTPDDLATMMSAVERFEGAVAALGGDSMTNAPDSSDPDDPDFVLPQRKRGERATEYALRLTEAANRLRPLPS